MRRAARRALPAVAMLAATAGLPALAAAQARRPAAATARAADEGRELTADQQVRHALGRLGFGARPGDEARVRAMGVDRWIALQLHPERIDDAAMTATLARFTTLGRPGAELLRDFPPPAQVLAQRARAARMAGDTGAPAFTREDSLRARQLGRESYRFVGELQTARVARAVASERQLQEVMVDFWANHFSIFAGKDRVRYHLPQYEATLRAHALGSFRELLGAVAKSPAMLQYLDNFQSVADSTRPTAGRRPQPLNARQRARLAERNPEAAQRLEQLMARRPRGLNENYARELLELHTLGVDGGYTQQDVIEVARALTGWSLQAPAQGGGFVFRPQVHDAGEKTILGQPFPAGRGIEDGEQVLDLVARHPSTARFIARKLAVRFVSDSPPPALVARAAETFRRTDGDIRATLETIVQSPEFFSRAAYRAKVKSPFELVVSAARALGAQPDTTPRTAQLIARLGQPIFGHQAPDGWPETGREWMNTGAILNRINFGLAVAANRLPGARLADWPQTATLRAAPKDAQLDGVIAALLGGEASKETRAVLASGTNPMLARAAADTTRGADEAPEMETPTMIDGTRAARTSGRRARAMNATNSTNAANAQAGRETARPNRAPAGAFGQLPRLDPFAQLVGLALGAPEFQRR
ncbi:hypothetical protein rosag_35640 [Roseisolibacter agri]|uniref:DUF1800 domain-containing protein n=2 Tax=Roseisolibacter agri TaxID=2014610 RepID=A0AA37QDT3_9BACT|nr:hypothetical protein rosag_35640 [Roseisolibacter agri]